MSHPAPANCTSIDHLSHKCSGLKYTASTSTQDAYTSPDRLVTFLTHHISRTLPTYSHKHHLPCRASIHMLSCTLVYPPCEQTTEKPSSEHSGMHYSELLRNVADSCNVHSEELADRLLRSSGCLGPRTLDTRGAVVDGVCLMAFLLIAWFCGWSLVAWLDAVCKDMVNGVHKHAENEKREQMLGQLAYSQEKDLIALV